MATIVPFANRTRTPVPDLGKMTGLLGDSELASELFAPPRPDESPQDYAARLAAGADILADLLGELPSPDGAPAAVLLGRVA
ncbi:hypothetical protein SAMN05421803_11772 [Nocardiopsis flavescens]|uniref:Uncharacterized protein n=1 Tax=Nocardiopsis flavescens TaxID=758803 RepID=A0A1M6REI6_9ACTN|nr:hypothetical protein [Nocardiopsis flavescens]SHK30816.1 hypothetical protein SAMN05421803_11772 [Nocardiopsis flavescens]